MFKNTAGKLTVLAFADAGHASLDAGELVTGDAANITCKVEQDDDGTRDALADTNPTETEDGQYVFDVAQAESNGDKLTFYPQSSTAGVQVVALPSNVIYTRPANWSNFESALSSYSATRGLAGTALPAAAADSAGGLVISDAGGLDVDSLLSAALAARNNSAYPGGAVCFDSANGAGGTTEFINGTQGNPCSLIADVVSLANARDTKRILNIDDGWLTGSVPTIASVDLSFFHVELNGGHWAVNSSNVTNDFVRWRNGILSDAVGRFKLGTACIYDHILFAGSVEVDVGVMYPCYGCTFYGTSSGVTIDLQADIITNRWLMEECWFWRSGVADAPVTLDCNGFVLVLEMQGCHGDLMLLNMTNAASVVKHYGWGKLIVDSTCTAGKIIHGAHVEILDENGDPYDGPVTTELVSEPGGVSSFSGAAATQVDAIESDTNELQTDWANGGRLDLLVDLILDEARFLMSVLMGAINNSQNAAEEYVITRDGNTFTVTFAGLDADGNRTGATLVKS